MDNNLFDKFAKLPATTQIALVIAVVVLLILVLALPGAGTNLFNLIVGVMMLVGK